MTLKTGALQRNKLHFKIYSNRNKKAVNAFYIHCKLGMHSSKTTFDIVWIWISYVLY